MVRWDEHVHVICVCAVSLCHLRLQACPDPVASACVPANCHRHQRKETEEEEQHNISSSSSSLHLCVLGSILCFPNPLTCCATERLATDDKPDDAELERTTKRTRLQNPGGWDGRGRIRETCQALRKAFLTREPSRVACSGCLPRRPGVPSVRGPPHRRWHGRRAAGTATSSHRP